MVKPNKKDYGIGVGYKKVEFQPYEYIKQLEIYIDYLELERNKNHLDNDINKF